MSSVTKQTPKATTIQQRSRDIIHIADSEPHSALKCIHLLNVAGGATAETFVAIEQRIIADQDVAGAYHLAMLAQTTPDIPIDARQLIELVVTKGDNDKRLSLLKNLPLPPVDAIRQQIMATDDAAAIAQMSAYLQVNPDGYGSQHIPASKQQERIVPLND